MIELIGPMRRAVDAAGQGHALQPLRHDLAGAVDVLAPLELDPHDRDAGARDRADAPDPRRAVERGLDGEGHEDLDLLRRHAAGLGDHGDRRRGEVGEDVDREPGGHDGAGDEEDGGHAEDDGAVAERGADDGVEHAALLSERAPRARPRREEKRGGSPPPRAWPPGPPPADPGG